MTAKAVLFALLILLCLYFAVRWFVLERRTRSDRQWLPSGGHIAIGFVANFFDMLGIGSFATTTSLFKFSRTVDDDAIPGTLNVGHAFPTLAEALISIALVTVEMKTLVTMIAAAVAGAYLGAGVVARWPKRKIQIGMGLLLFAAATIIAVRQLALVSGGIAIGVSGISLGAAVAGNFVLGALMTLGIGLFAPCMILVSVLGMDPKTAFPIMMGSCAFLMPVASLRFVSAGRYNLRAALGLTAGGVPAVLIAAYIVKSLPLKAMQWLIVAVVIYTAIAMLRSAQKILDVPRTPTGPSSRSGHSPADSNLQDP